MEWTSLNDLREKYLSFFESKGHLRLPSFSLIPNNDNSLLLINSGMAPMKKYFTGEITPPRNRVTTCQKCIRTPDIEEVGKTDRHGTFFEMLGNFSIGDYLKKEATAWAWEFCIKVLEITVDKLYVTIAYCPFWLGLQDLGALLWSLRSMLGNLFCPWRKVRLRFSRLRTGL